MNKGFSLVELSIVLVILGLLTGGILAGQSLIRAAELRAVSAEFSRYVTATQTFRDKYFAIPGDMQNATDFWEEFGNGGTGSCPDTAGTGTETCDGDGDGILSQNNTATDSMERFQYWRQLANAGLIEGTYSGLGATISASIHGACETDGTNCPRSKLGDATWQAEYRAGSSTANFYESRSGNALTFGKRYINAGNSTNNRGAVLSTEEAWNIDTKMDDGKPGMGSMLTYKSGTASAQMADTNACADDADPSVAEYDVSLTGLECAVYFIAF